MALKKESRALSERIGDGLTFFKQWVMHPRKIGSVIPSTIALGEAMVRPILAMDDKEGLIIQLGGGTGAITAGLIRAGVKPQDIIVIEYDDVFVKRLKRRFSEQGVEIIHGDATDAQRIVGSMTTRPVRGVVSCIPLVSLPVSVGDRILHEASQLAGANGKITQYTYKPTNLLSDLRLERLGLVAKREEWIRLNVPPACIWSFTIKDLQT